MTTFFFVLCSILFSHPIYCLRPSFLHSPSYIIRSRNSDPGSHSRIFSPLPATVGALHFYHDKKLSSSLVDSRRIVPTHSTVRRRSQQLMLYTRYIRLQNITKTQSILLIADYSVITLCMISQRRDQKRKTSGTCRHKEIKSSSWNLPRMISASRW